ncbi:MAG: cytochrome c class I [Cyclobacteriaceae bacterium]|nr:cytochrome c class I [Cyclobacteriaceae bacterium]UYN85129.1 MAG: cytochrome c class I [Cyclobacteriaceae bacterium]
MTKKILVMALFISGLASCGGNKTTDQAQDEPVQLSTNQLAAIGKILVDESDCKTCHHPTNKIIGPAHKEVAEKYEFTDANIKYLAKRIIEGGSGVWGEVPMNGHPDMKQEDAEKMAIYVLSLDGEERK